MDGESGGEEFVDSGRGVLKDLGDSGGEFGAELDDSDRKLRTGLFADSLGIDGKEVNS